MKNFSSQLQFILFLLCGVIFMGLLSSCTELNGNQVRNISVIETNKVPITHNSSLKKCIVHPEIHFFMYHYVRDYDIHDTPITRDLSIPPSEFRKHMSKVRELADTGKIALMNGDAFLKELKNGCFSDKVIWIFSADDGWSDMYTNLYPAIEEYKIPFFLGIVTSFLDKKGFITTGDLLGMSKDSLVTIASHSKNHLDNSKLNEKSETEEVCDSKKILENIIGKDVQAYIYPSGRMNEKIDDTILASCGYTIAWSTGFGREYNSTTGSLYDLNRIRIHGDTKVEFFDEILKK